MLIYTSWGILLLVLNFSCDQYLSFKMMLQTMTK